eukprot:8864237-Alexandrium_andersonii.AAC.1
MSSTQRHFHDSFQHENPSGSVQQNTVHTSDIGILENTSGNMLQSTMHGSDIGISENTSGNSQQSTMYVSDHGNRRTPTATCSTARSRTPCRRATLATPRMPETAAAASMTATT